MNATRFTKRFSAHGAALSCKPRPYTIPESLYLLFLTKFSAMKLPLVVGFAITACLALARSHAHGTLFAPTHHLPRRFDHDYLASDKDWKAASCRGAKLIDLMLGSDEEAGPKIGSTKGNNPPSAKSEWRGDLKRTLHMSLNCKVY